MRTSRLLPWGIGLALAVSMIYVPYLYYRYTLEHAKRLRPIVEGRFYRSGCLTADGFREAIRKHQIKTVINLMEENPDPDLPYNRFRFGSVKESELCKEMGVDFHFIYVETNEPGALSQPTVDKFLKLMDRETIYPVLLHCKAGLHRTGVLAAVYRMEYDGYSAPQAMRELKAHGFGDYIANRSNPYIRQYVLDYKPRAALPASRAVPAVPVHRRSAP